MAAYTNTGLGDLREGRHVGVLSEALSCSPKELWQSLHKATSIRTNQNKNVSYYNWTPSPTCLYSVYTTPLQVNRPPSQYLHTKEWRHGNEALSWLCLLPPILATYYHLVPFCLLMQNVYKYTEVSIAQLDTGSRPSKRAKKSVDKDKKIGELDLARNRFTLEEYVGGISAHTAI